jgi:hypothetical protein
MRGNTSSQLKSLILRCPQLTSCNVLSEYASARRYFARLVSEIILSSLQSQFFSYWLTNLVSGKRDKPR